MLTALTDMTGFKPADAIGSNLDFLQGLESSTAAVNFIRHCFRNELACCQDIVNYRKDGSAFVNRLVMLPFKQQNLHYLGFQNDVTDRYDNDADKIELSDMIHGEICHVLNNALGSILLSLDLAIEQGNDSTRQ